MKTAKDIFKDNNNNYINQPGSEISTIQLTEPSIAVSAITLDDIDRADKSSYPDKLSFRFPIVKINNYNIKCSDLINFQLDYSSFLPTITVEFYDFKNMFMTYAFPHDGSIIKIYIGGQGDELYYKPIRQDFVITSIQNVGNNPKQNDGHASRYRVSGTLNVPVARRKESWCIGKENSRTELFNLATYMGLGFATNFDKDMNVDKMNWICNQKKTMLDFTKEVTEHACYSQCTFFTSFIDQFYVLNFIEVHSLLSHGGDKTDVPAMIYSSMPQLGRPDGDEQNKDNTEKKTSDELQVNNEDDELNNLSQKVSSYFLSNNSHYMGWTNYIEEFTEVNDGFVSMSDGYKKHLVYSDVNTGGWGGNTYEFLISPIDNMKRDDSTQKIKSFGELTKETYIPLNLAQMSNQEYADMDSNDIDNMCSNESIIDREQVDTTNTFKLYYFAGVQNDYQMRCLKKCGLRVKLQNYNPSITKFSRIWVDIYEKNKFSSQALTKIPINENYSDNYNDYINERNDDIISFEDEGDENKNYPNTAYNRALSGWYVVTEMKIVFNAKEKRLQTQLLLNRIEYRPNYRHEYEIAKKSVEKYKEENKLDFLFNII